MSLVCKKKRLESPEERPASSPSGEQLIEARVQSKLQRSGYRQLRGVTCEFHEGVLTLSGRVSSYHLKQIVQTLVRGMEGVVEIRNGVEVA